METIARTQTYAANPLQLKEQCAQPGALNLYASLVLGEEFTKPFPATHQAYWALLVRAAKAEDLKELRYALGLPRGFAKTTLIKLFTTWLFAYTEFRFALVVSTSLGKAEHVISDITAMMDSQNYKTLFGNWRFECERDSQELKIFRFRNQWRILHALGAEGSVRGLNIKNRRPDVILLEDAQDKESAQNPVQNDKFLEWFLGTLYKARSYERSLCIFIGNMYNETCVLNKLRQNKLWISLISGAITRSGESIWPEFRPIHALLDEMEMDTSVGKQGVFLAEVMNDPLGMANSAFDSTLIKPYQFDPIELPSCAFIIIDPALGKLTSDDTVIGLVHVVESKPVLRKAIRGKLDDTQTVDAALQLALTERACLIAVESVAYQATLCNYFRRTLNQRGLRGIEIVETGPRGRSKNARIKDAGEKWLKQQIDAHPDIRPQLIAQYQRWNPLRKDNEDDLIDVFAYMDPVLAENWGYLYTSIDDSFIPGAADSHARVLPESETCCF